MKKCLFSILVIFLLAGCSDKVEEELDTDIIFKEEIVSVSEIGNARGKVLADEILVEEIDEIFNGIFDLAIFESSTVEYGEITQGAGSNGEGKKVFCCKLPVNVKFIGTEKSVEKFVEYFKEIDNVVSFGEFNIESLEDDKYEVTTLVNFLGKATGGSLSTGKKQYAIKKNEVQVQEEEDIVLRDFDVSMIIRPNNSDSASISFGVTEEKDYRIYNDGNEKKDVNITFSNEGSKYYCEYSFGKDSTTKAEIKPSKNILFDILSCEVENSDDKVAVDLYIFNNSNKKVSLDIYDDKDGRVNISEKVGSVEVKK